MKIVNAPVKWSGASTIALSASRNSDPIKIERLDRIAIQIVWDGAATGDFTLQVCNDEGQGGDAGLEDVTGLTNWNTVTGSTQAAGGAAGSHTWDVETSAKWIRVVYTRSSGTANLTGRIHAKGAF